MNQSFNLVGDDQILATEVVDEDFLEAAETITEVEQCASGLVNAWIEDYGGGALQLCAVQYELTVASFDYQQLLYRDHLRLIVFLDCFRQLVP